MSKVPVEMLRKVFPAHDEALFKAIVGSLEPAVDAASDLTLAEFGAVLMCVGAAYLTALDPALSLVEQRRLAEVINEHLPKEMLLIVTDPA